MSLSDDDVVEDGSELSEGRTSMHDFVPASNGRNGRTRMATWIFVAPISCDMYVCVIMFNTTLVAVGACCCHDMIVGTICTFFHRSSFVRIIGNVRRTCAARTNGLKMRTISQNHNKEQEREKNFRFKEHVLQQQYIAAAQLNSKA